MIFRAFSNLYLLSKENTADAFLRSQCFITFYNLSLCPSTTCFYSKKSLLFLTGVKCISQTIAKEILALYRAEASSGSFEKQLKNNLDETLVKNISSIENGQELNIEDTVNLAFNEFNKYLKTK